VGDEIVEDPGKTISKDGMTYPNKMENGSIARSYDDTNSTLLACVDGKGLATGDVRRWINRNNGVETAKAKFWTQNP
jgi:hypothetical protein